MYRICHFYTFVLYLEFYRKMSEELVSILKPDDVTSYKPLVLPVLRQNFMNYTIITSNEGTGGPILMDVLSKMNTTSDNLSLLNSFKGKAVDNL